MTNSTPEERAERKRLRRERALKYQEDLDKRRKLRANPLCDLRQEIFNLEYEWICEAITLAEGRVHVAAHLVGWERTTLIERLKAWRMKGVKLPECLDGRYE